MAARPRRLHAYHFAGEAIRETVEHAFPERQYVVWSEPDQLAAGIGEVEHLLALRPPRGLWAGAERLRLVQMSGAGVDSLLPAPDLPEGVRVANARGVHEPDMPEFLLAMVLALARRLPRAAAQQARREWKMFAGTRLAGATAGILGLGTIGASLAWRLRALGMRVVGTRRSGEPLDDVDAVYGPGETDRVLAESDVVVVLLPYTEATRGLLDEAALRRMKPRALLVNAARGGIVDEEALARALHEGRLGGAALDVFAQEPLPPSSPLWDAPDCLVTPHVAGLRRDYMERVAELWIENVRRVEAGRAPRNEVDPARGY